MRSKDNSKVSLFMIVKDPSSNVESEGMTLVYLWELLTA